jgi:ABC-type Fe3+ transport system permease subunit
MSDTQMLLLLLALAVVWLSCGVLACGIENAYFWHEWPTLQSESEFRMDFATNCICIPFGLVALLVAFFGTGFAYYGLLYRYPGKRS